ncbi:MAG: hypothetical protein H7Z74_05080 [Anaerolineae bacterium]|nr:hypothetical protein [Gemmatimonadaceae bacterium]
MLTWIIAVVVGSALAIALYGLRESSALSRLVPVVLLRAVALVVLFALLFDAPSGRRRAPNPIVALDVSESWLRGGDTALWRTARDRARSLTRDSLWLFGDSIRGGTGPELPSDQMSASASIAERALASGRPVVLLTDGELDDPGALRELPSGSRVEAAVRADARDIAIVSMDAPRGAVVGDTIEVQITLRAGALASADATLTFQLGNATVAGAALLSMPARSEQRKTVRFPVGAAEGALALVAAVQSAGDSEPRNDTVGTALDVTKAPGAVLVSSSPDYDSRFLLPVLRGAVSLPTRAYYRVTPTSWRGEATLTTVNEAEVRRVLRSAPLAIIHGDTAVFGPPRTATSGALMLITPPVDTSGEWYPAAAPPSPVSAALSGIAWDSLPPIEASASITNGEWSALAAARARDPDRHSVISGTDRPRRIVTVGASGFWRWHFRGGASADAYAALWGSIFDWLAEARSDVRAAVPAEGIVRAGERVRWRQGTTADSVVVAVLRRRGDSASVDSILLRFGADGIAESAAPTPGKYDVAVTGGSALLVVNASRELLPRAPAVVTGAVGRAAAIGDAPRLRDSWWPYLAVLVALCAEWLLRRRIGLR